LFVKSRSKKEEIMGSAGVVQQRKLDERRASVIFSRRKADVHPKEAFYIFNGNIAALCGDSERHSVLRTRCLALEGFLQQHGEKHRVALFQFFREWMPHWKCTSEFSVENLFVFVRKLSCSHFFMSHHYNPSITAPKHKTFVSHATREKTAMVERKRAACLVCPDKDAAEFGKRKLQICHGCATLLGKSLSNGLISEKATNAKIISFLQKKREEKRRKLTSQKRRTGSYGRK